MASIPKGSCMLQSSLQQAAAQCQSIRSCGSNSCLYALLQCAWRSDPLYCAMQSLVRGRRPVDFQRSAGVGDLSQVSKTLLICSFIGPSLLQAHLYRLEHRLLMNLEGGALLIIQRHWHYVLWAFDSSAIRCLACSTCTKIAACN